MRILESIAAVLFADWRGAYVIHVREPLASDVEASLRQRGFHRIEPQLRPNGDVIIAFIHRQRSEAIRHAMDGRFSALNRAAIRYLSSVYGPRWPALAL